jgi:hypothetical protein
VGTPLKHVRGRERAGGWRSGAYGTVRPQLRTPTVLTVRRARAVATVAWRIAQACGTRARTWHARGTHIPRSSRRRPCSWLATRSSARSRPPNPCTTAAISGRATSGPAAVFSEASAVRASAVCIIYMHADTHRQHPSRHRTSTAWVTCRQPTHQAARPRDCCEKMLGQTRPGHPATRRRLHISAVLLHVSSTHTGAVPASSPAACLHVQAGTCVRRGW